MNAVTKLTTSFSQFQKDYKKTQKENEEAFEIISDQVQKFDKRVNDLGKTVKSKYEAPKGENTGRKEKGTSTYDADAVRETREAIKNKQNK